MFKQALRLKIRFSSAYGQINVEDLWDLPLTKLDTLAKAAHAELEANRTQTSFVEAKTTGNTILELRLDILKVVIADVIADRDSVKTSKARKDRKDKIAAFIAEREDSDLANMPKDELQKLYDAA